LFRPISPPHWRFLAALDADVLHLSRFIELTPENFATYSLELSRILFAAAAEVDVVAKLLCKKIDPASTAHNIGVCRAVIAAKMPLLLETVIEIPRYSLTLKPWESWSSGTSPLWWDAYNNVKHNRHTHFSDASLINAINAVAGLFAILLFLYRDESQNAQLAPDPILFIPGSPFTLDTPAYGGNTVFYQLK
jgi:hypothetical protein